MEVVRVCRRHRSLGFCSQQKNALPFCLLGFGSAKQMKFMGGREEKLFLREVLSQRSGLKQYAFCRLGC